MSMFELYLLTRLEPLRDFLQFSGFTFLVNLITIFVSLGYIICFILINFDGDKESEVEFAKKIYPGLKPVVKIALCLMFLFNIIIPGTRAIIPTERDLAIIFAGHWATNSEDVKKLPKNVVKTMNKFMDKYNKEQELKTP